MVNDYIDTFTVYLDVRIVWTVVSIDINKRVNESRFSEVDSVISGRIIHWSKKLNSQLIQNTALPLFIDRTNKIHTLYKLDLRTVNCNIHKKLTMYSATEIIFMWVIMLNYSSNYYAKLHQVSVNYSCVANYKERWLGSKWC